MGLLAELRPRMKSIIQLINDFFSYEYDSYTTRTYCGATGKESDSGARDGGGGRSMGSGELVN